ncbi:MAG TPA: adenosylcobinamide-GDP ribazoletransferase [Candidatus Limnocylindrales bacterium]
MAEVVARDDAPPRGHPLAELVAAIAFLTRVPVRPLGDSRSRTGAAAFGLVGALIGAVAAAPVLLAGAGHPLPGAIAAIGLLALLDGGLHLDGLADTFDALAAPSGAADRARTDPQAGTAGVVAIVVTLGLAVASIAEVAAADAVRASAVVVAAAALSRATAPVWAVAVGRHRRAAGGLGTWFADEVTRGAAVVALVTAAVIVLVLVEFAGPGVALASVAGLAAAAIAGLVLVRLRGQLDGDGYGAIIELTFASIVLSAALLG